MSYSTKAHREHPEPHFYLFKLDASLLRSLSGIARRTTLVGQLRSEDLGIQRRHDPKRSQEIGEFIRYGYPWSELAEKKRQSESFNDLRKPGWLPTAIVVNILTAADQRRGQKVSPKDLIDISTTRDSLATISLPDKVSTASWKPSLLPPIEVIDGQHRLWAFESDGRVVDFELPVVAFHGLDISWQAYLFWTINIKPKRINPSLAFDLYPLLRTEDWLEKFEGHSIYRETRAQELTEALWAFTESPWHDRINMLGDPGTGQTMVSQAAWIRSLMATFVKAWEGKRVQIGGLFGAPVGEHKEALPWSRAQQAAFLIRAGRSVRDSIKNCSLLWARSLRTVAKQQKLSTDLDPAFYGPYTLMSTDQGIRGLLHVINDMCFVRTRELKLESWSTANNTSASDEKAVQSALASLKTQPVSEFLDEIADGLAAYDWRTSSFPSLSEDERIRKAALRGSGGYKELRQDLLRTLSGRGRNVGRAASTVISALGYNAPRKI